jgi:hypothetical protein
VAGVGEGLAGGCGAGDEGGGEVVVELVGTDAAAAVDGEVPGDADVPDAEVADGREIELVGFAGVLQNAEEGVLDAMLAPLQVQTGEWGICSGIFLCGWVRCC